MGDRAGFIARPKDGIQATSLATELVELGAKIFFSDDYMGLVIGIMKASYPGGCKNKLINCEMVGKFVSLSEKSTGTTDDYTFLSGDRALAMRLKTRVKDPKSKGEHGLKTAVVNVAGKPIKTIKSTELFFGMPLEK